VGVNGLWLQGVLNRLAVFMAKPVFGVETGAAALFRHAGGSGR
jgi:hypothetical protein